MGDILYMPLRCQAFQTRAPYEAGHLMQHAGETEVSVAQAGVQLRAVCFNSTLLAHTLLLYIYIYCFLVTSKILQGRGDKGFDFHFLQRLQVSA